MLPLQACGPGLGEEADSAFLVLDFPLLSGVVEFDVAGALDFEPAKFTKRDGVGPKAMGCAVGVEVDLDVDVHVSGVLCGTH